MVSDAVDIGGARQLLVDKRFIARGGVLRTNPPRGAGPLDLAAVGLENAEGLCSN